MLSTTAEHAIRAMAYLARVSSDRVVLGREIAREANIPAGYLSKILAVLRNAGLVESTRGTGGGYRLQKPPAEIFLVDIVEPFEVLRRPGLCLLGHSRECSDNDACSAHAIWRNLRATYMGLLVSTSLAMLIGETTEPRPGAALAEGEGATNAY